MLKVIPDEQFTAHMSALEEVSMSASSRMGQGAYASTGQGDKAATWGHVLSAITDETRKAFSARLKRLQEYGMLTDTTTLFDVAERTLGYPFRPGSYIPWAMDLDDATFALLSLVGCAADLESQDVLVDELASVVGSFRSEEEVIAMLRNMRAPLGEQSFDLKTYTADIISQLGIARTRAAWAPR